MFWIHLNRAEERAKTWLQSESGLDSLVPENLAHLYHQRQDPRARELARRAYEFAPEHPKVLDTYASVLLAEGKQEQALRLMEMSVARAPERLDHQFHLARGLAAAGETVQARAQLRALVELEKDFPEKPQAVALFRRLR